MQKPWVQDSLKSWQDMSYDMMVHSSTLENFVAKDTTQVTYGGQPYLVTISASTQLSSLIQTAKGFQTSLPCDLMITKSVVIQRSYSTSYNYEGRNGQVITNTTDSQSADNSAITYIIHSICTG